MREGRGGGTRNRGAGEERVVLEVVGGWWFLRGETRRGPEKWEREIWCRGDERDPKDEKKAIRAGTSF